MSLTSIFTHVHDVVDNVRLEHDLERQLKHVSPGEIEDLFAVLDREDSHEADVMRRVLGRKRQEAFELIA